MDPTRICYQSYVDHENGKTYWGTLKPHLIQVSDDGTAVDVWGITPFDSYAHALLEFRCAREMICNAVRAEREGYDAFIVGHFQDAGFYEARAAVDIPVIALGEASMLYFCQLGQRIGIVTTNTRFIPWFHHQIGKYGLKECVTAIHAMVFEPGQILEAYDSGAKAKEIKALFEKQARPLIANGVDVLIPGGGIPIAVKMAEMAVKLRRMIDLNVSRASDFAQPPEHIIDEFPANPKGL